MQIRQGRNGGLGFRFSIAIVKCPHMPQVG